MKIDISHENTLAYQEAKNTCNKILDIIQKDVKVLSEDILENTPIEYFGSIVSTILNTILINLVRGLDIPNMDHRKDYFLRLLDEIQKLAVEAYFKNLYLH